MRGEEPHGSAALPSLPAFGWVLGTAGAGSGPQHPKFIRATPNIPGAADSTHPSLLPILSRTFGCSSGDAVLPGRGAGSPLVPTGRGCPRCAPKPGSLGPHSTQIPPLHPSCSLPQPLAHASRRGHEEIIEALPHSSPVWLSGGTGARAHTHTHTLTAWCTLTARDGDGDGDTLANPAAERWQQTPRHTDGG